MSSTINNCVYDEQADTWWDEDHFLYLLKAMVNPWRVPYFENVMRVRFGGDLGRVRLLDLGCGGGVLAEEYAVLGCRVTGIDISSKSIKVARNHAGQRGLKIDYRVASATELPFDDASFDIVSCCDMLEHVPQWKRVIAEASRVLAPGGLFFFDTINRTPKSKVTFIQGLQEIAFTRLMPPNTHVWEMFITPEELSAALREYGLIPQDFCGGKIARGPLATLVEVRRQKRGEISFGELGRRLRLKADPDLTGNYLGWACKPA